MPDFELHAEEVLQEAGASAGSAVSVGLGRVRSASLHRADQRSFKGYKAFSAAESRLTGRPGAHR